METCPRCGDESFELVQSIDHSDQYVWYCTYCDHKLTGSEYERYQWEQDGKNKLISTGSFCEKKAIGNSCHCRKCLPEEW